MNVNRIAQGGAQAGKWGDFLKWFNPGRATATGVDAVGIIAHHQDFFQRRGIKGKQAIVLE